MEKKTNETAARLARQRRKAWHLSKKPTRHLLNHRQPGAALSPVAVIVEHMRVSNFDELSRWLS
eukprot:7511450-Prorocentrum_lima.AAC.1